ncbi:MAG: hypothetical protein JWQ27_2979 [Ferruginibacter sp.]|nr:hypothetical protein [Ferruginibacter sp.]
MARTNKGILGHFNGTVGTVVGATWRGVEYMRSKSKRRTKAATPGQLDQQAKFRLVTAFIKALGGIVGRAFNDPGAEMTGRNRAFAYNFRNALMGTYPAYALDYTRVLVSEGILLSASIAPATDGGNGQVHFTWTPNTGGNADDSDSCTAVVYCPDLNRSVSSVNGDARSAGSHTLDAAMFAGKTVQTWLFFNAANGRDVSTSVYTGQVVLA